MTQQTQPQIALIKAAQAGDSAAFETLLQCHYNRMYRFAYQWCGNTEDAQDITQQACLKLARSLAQFQFNSAFTTWLYRLVVNCAIDWHRGEQKHQTHSAEEAETSQPSQHDTGIYLQQILTTLESWGEGFKATVLLVLGEGLTHAEAANVLAVKESTISWRLHQIRKKLNLLNATEGGRHE